MHTYVYPFEGFLKDFKAVASPGDGNPQPQDLVERFRRVNDYLKATYSDSTDVIERGSALSMVVSFLGRNLDLFDTGSIAVAGPKEALVSNHLLRAAHELICPVSAGDSNEMPTPAAVLALAERFASENRGEE